MPAICRFYGVAIYMYHNDHPPPHFHAEYGGDEAVYRVETLELTRGSIPRRAQALVLEWAASNRAALVRNWQLARDGKPLEMLEPLE